jgi:membrane protein implicated in regulation of membrane protease activity
MIGERAKVYSWSPGGTTGKVFCHGEYWNARGPSGLQPGDEVEVDGLDGLILTVRPVTGSDRPPDTNG